MKYLETGEIYQNVFEDGKKTTTQKKVFDIYFYCKDWILKFSLQHHGPAFQKLK